MLDFEIGAREVADRLKSEPGLVLLDVREPWEVATAHIAGAKPMPMGEIPSRVFAELDPEAHIVTFLPLRRPFPECRRLVAQSGI